MSSITTRFLMTCPAMSAYEFDHFREEAAVQERWRSSSLYMICQRPVIFFDDVVAESGVISGRIRQRGNETALRFELDVLPGQPYFGSTCETIIELGFYDQQPAPTPPFKNVAAIKLFDSDEQFTGYLSPERLLFEHLRIGNFARIEGDISALLRYEVHYIGQAQDQPIERRLRSHETFQRILAREFPRIAQDIPTMEISLLFFGIEYASTPVTFQMLDGGELSDSQGRPLSDEEIGAVLLGTPLERFRSEIVNDAEAYLINFMLPRYNRVRYANYPLIAKDLRSCGFSRIEHHVIPFGTLKTEEATIEFSVSPLFSH